MNDEHKIAQNPSTRLKMDATISQENRLLKWGPKLSDFEGFVKRFFTCFCKK